MGKETSRNVRLGIFVFTGAFLLVLALYFIGDKQNLFGSTVTIKANFSNVNGLTVGNNVRYMGIDVGTVSSIRIINDSTVFVEMTIDSDAINFIKKNAVATIGTDGLMGNKLVNIRSKGGNAAYIAEGTILKTIAPLETEEIMRTLSQTNDDMYLIAENLKSITTKIEEENMIWNLLSDTVIANNLRRTLVNVEYTSQEIAEFSNSFKQISRDIERGDGLMGTLLRDTTLSNDISSTMKNLQVVSDSLNKISKDLSFISNHVKKGEGGLGTVIMDPKFEKDLNESLENIKNASQGLEENMEALKHNVLFRRYFRKQDKKKE